MGIPKGAVPNRRATRQLAHDARPKQRQEDHDRPNRQARLRDHPPDLRRQPNPDPPPRRVNQAIWLICTGAREAAFRNIKTIAECLADEIMNAAKGSSNSYAIKKKDELERVAKSNR